MKEYDLYLPLTYNDGRPVEDEKIRSFKRSLLEQFGGLTHFTQQNEGLWKLGNITFRDRIVILRVLADEPAEARRFFSTFRRQVQTELAQANILIVERDVAAVD